MRRSLEDGIYQRKAFIRGRRLLVEVVYWREAFIRGKTVTEFERSHCILIFEKIIFENLSQLHNC